MVGSHREWSPDDLFAHNQANFAAHLALMFHYLRDKGMNVDDFMRYVGEQAAAGWQECENAGDMMNGVLLNVLANGGEIQDAQIAPLRSEAVVSGPLNLEVMEHYGAPIALAERVWEKYAVIAESLGYRFHWKRLSGDVYQLLVEAR